MPERMPTVFIGHGSPDNALADNAFTRSLSELASSLPRPEAVLVISAHYLTGGVGVTSAPHPRTIHDFYGFPQPLFDVSYPAPGSPELSAQVADFLGGREDREWGLDHASWAVLRHMYPDADVPVVELSLDLSLPASEHFALGRALSSLRDQGVLVLGSGNIVHNLRAVRWEEEASPYAWAIEFDDAIAEALASRDDSALVAYHSLPGASSAVPTPDHYLPLLYAVAAAGPNAVAVTTHEGIEMGSVSMRCVRLG